MSSGDCVLSPDIRAAWPAPVYCNGRRRGLNESAAIGSAFYNELLTGPLAQPFSEHRTSRSFAPPTAMTIFAGFVGHPAACVASVNIRAPTAPKHFMIFSAGC